MDKKSTHTVWGMWGKLDTRSTYLWGVGVGLTISWVTGALAYLKGNQFTALYDLILLEFIVSVIMFSVAYLINTKKGVESKR